MVIAGKNLCPFWRSVLSWDCPLREGMLLLNLSPKTTCLKRSCCLWPGQQSFKTGSIVLELNLFERPDPIGHQVCSPRQVVLSNRFNYNKMQDLLPRMCGLSRQAVSPGSCSSRQVSLYQRWSHRFDIVQTATPNFFRHASYKWHTWYGNALSTCCLPL